jgi:hypothetical protein
MSDQGIRSVLGNLLSHVREYDMPPAGTKEYAAFIDQWADRLLRTTGYYREQERAKNDARRTDSDEAR